MSFIGKADRLHGQTVVHNLSENEDREEIKNDRHELFSQFSNIKNNDHLIIEENNEQHDDSNIKEKRIELENNKETIDNDKHLGKDNLSPENSKEPEIEIDVNKNIDLNEYVVKSFENIINEIPFFSHEEDTHHDVVNTDIQEKVDISEENKDIKININEIKEHPAIEAINEAVNVEVFDISKQVHPAINSPDNSELVFNPIQNEMAKNDEVENLEEVIDKSKTTSEETKEVVDYIYFIIEDQVVDILASKYGVSSQDESEDETEARNYEEIKITVSEVPNLSPSKREKHNIFIKEKSISKYSKTDLACLIL